jgi:hypothetical protein
MDNFKLTVEQDATILAKQAGVCAGCLQPEPVKGRSLSTDHDHRTGLVRGKLCSRCNPLLGKVENAFRRYGLGRVPNLKLSQLLFRLAGYIALPPATQALGYEHIGYTGRTGTKAHRARLRKERKKTYTIQKPIGRKK